MKKFILLFTLIFILSACSLPKENSGGNIDQNKITDFTSCVAAGNPVMESYPRQCRGDGRTFTEVLKGAGESCVQNADCQLPMEFAIQSNCPYETLCYEGKCAVGCPLWESQTNEWQVNCQSDKDCDCRGWDRENKYTCVCVSGKCISIVAGIGFDATNAKPPVETSKPVACTQEAKLCPDGSYVSRTGPNCEFGVCPTTTNGDQAESCRDNNGNWLAQYNECENDNRDWCVKAGGVFKKCESACRHDPQAQICTMNCVPVCRF
jgi:hypothetical protein